MEVKKRIIEDVTYVGDVEEFEPDGCEVQRGPSLKKVLFTAVVGTLLGNGLVALIEWRNKKKEEEEEEEEEDF